MAGPYDRFSDEELERIARGQVSTSQNMPTVTPLPQTPSGIREEARLRLAQEAAVRQAENDAARIDLARQAEARQQAEYERRMLGVGRKPLREGDAQKLTDDVEIVDALQRSLNGFQDGYSGFGAGIENTAQGYVNVGTPGQRDWWASFRSTDNIIRNKLFGASLTDGEKSAYNETTITPGMNAAEIKKNLQTRLNIAQKAAQRRYNRLNAAGYNPEEVNAVVGEVDLGLPARKPAAAGADTQSVPLPPEMQREHAEWIAARQGNIDPLEYSAFRQQLDTKYGFGSQPDEYERYIRDNQGKASTKPIAEPTAPLTSLDALRNSAVTNPVGGFAADAFNMGGFGLPEAMAGDQYAALRDEYPVATTLGQVAGAIGGTGMVGRAGKAGMDAITRGAPRLGQQLARTNPFARNLATDAAYSGIYGANTGQDPLASAAWGAGGSAFGQGAGKLASAAVRGASVSPVVQKMREAGIPLTVGQTLGGIPKAIEDKLTSVPGLGDMLRNRRIEGLQGLNKAAFREAGAPIGFTPSDIGKEGLQELFDASGRAYSDATSGVNAPLDAKAMSDLAMARAMGQRMPPNMQAGYEKVMQNYIDPVTDAGTMSGDLYQQTNRALKGHKGKPPGDAFEQEWKDAISVNQDALRGAMERGGGQRTVDGLNAADATYRSAKTLEDAILDRAAGGSQSGESFVATPNQLQRAGRKSQKKYPGPRPFETLADAAQDVLPSQIPDSGTAGRVAAMTVGGGLLGGGAGYIGGGDLETAAQGAALAGLLASGGTRTAQDLGIASLTKRPEIMRQIGREIERRRGLIGSGSLPFFIVQ